MGKHLTFEQRCKLAALHDASMSQAAIAAQIGPSQLVVSRELRRNQGGQGGYGYRCQQAQATARRTAAGRTPRKMTPSVIATIEAKLCGEQWSPQQISVWLAQTQQTPVGRERIYQHIRGDKQAGGTPAPQ